MNRTIEHRQKYKQFYAIENQSSSEQERTDSDSREQVVKTKRSWRDNEDLCKNVARAELPELHQRTYRIAGEGIVVETRPEDCNDKITCMGLE